jgi:hypothetical protein
MEKKRQLQSMSDDELLHRLAELMRDSRRVESELVAHIAEVDERRLYAREASPSKFAYCTQVLHLSGAEAYLRIAAPRASREHPMLLEMLADGRLHLSGIARLAPHLTRENAEGLLKRAVHKSKRQIEELIAEFFPRPDAPAVMRKLPTTRGQAQPRAGTLGAGALGLDDSRDESGLSVGPHGLASSVELRPDVVVTSEPEARLDGANRPNRRRSGLSVVSGIPDGMSPAPAIPNRRSFSHATSQATPSVVQPLAPARYRVQFTASAELHHKLERLRALMRTKFPDGDLAAIIEEAVSEKLERLEARRFATTKNPRKGLSKTDTAPSSRRIPSAVRRAVYERDGSRCRYVDKQGRQCAERHRLEFHHSHPLAFGGDHGPNGIRLMCRAHNLYLAEHDYGRQAMERYRRSGGQVSEAGPVPLPRSDGNPRARDSVGEPGDVHLGHA